MSSSERANSHQVAPSHRSTFMISLESTAQRSAADQARAKHSRTDPRRSAAAARKQSKQSEPSNDRSFKRSSPPSPPSTAPCAIPLSIYRPSFVVDRRLYPTVSNYIHPSGQANCVSRKQSVSTFFTPRAQHHHHQHDHQHDHHERAVRASFAVFQSF